jgi:hypothetical protein
MHFYPDGREQLNQRGVSDNPAEYPHKIPRLKALPFEQGSREVNSNRTATRRRSLEMGDIAFHFMNPCSCKQRLHQTTPLGQSLCRRGCQLTKKLSLRQLRKAVMTQEQLKALGELALKLGRSPLKPFCIFVLTLLAASRGKGRKNAVVR